ncbi:dicarboxylate/amino acid:cation symporter [Pilibacter termitis]|nr:dicarboxylate/amino acid:cation symporter [Pilibacter termitis]
MSFAKKSVLSLVLGVVFGLIFVYVRENSSKEIWTTLTNLLFVDITQEGQEKSLGLFYLVGQLFLKSLQFIIVPLIFTSIVKAIEHIHDTSLLNKIAKKTFGNLFILLSIALVIGTVVGLTGYSMNLFHFEAPKGLDNVSEVKANGNPLTVLLDLVQPNLVATFTNNGAILSVVLLALIVGIGLQSFKEKTLLSKLNDEINMLAIKYLNFVILKLSPFAIFALITRTFASYGLNYLGSAMVYMLLTIVTLFFFVLVVFSLILKFVIKVNPRIYFKKMYKVALFAFSTSSSVATLPLNLETTTDELGMNKDIASFIVPLATTLNMTGTAIMQIIATYFIAKSGGYSIGFSEIVLIIALTLIGSLSTPAAPGAGAILLYTIISGLGFVNPSAMAAYTLILAINRPVEMLVTAVNVLDDSISGLWIAKDLDMLDETIYENEQIHFETKN